jgi:hypothetical protein
MGLIAELKFRQLPTTKVKVEPQSSPLREGFGRSSILKEQLDSDDIISSRFEVENIQIKVQPMQYGGVSPSQSSEDEDFYLTVETSDPLASTEDAEVDFHVQEEDDSMYPPSDEDSMSVSSFEISPENDGSPPEGEATRALRPRRSVTKNYCKVDVNSEDEDEEQSEKNEDQDSDAKISGDGSDGASSRPTSDSDTDAEWG